MAKRTWLLTAALALCSLCLLCGCHVQGETSPQDDAAQGENSINGSVAIDESGRSVSVTLIKKKNSEQWEWTCAVNPNNVLIETDNQQVKSKRKDAATQQIITLQAEKAGQAVVRFTPRYNDSEESYMDVQSCEYVFNIDDELQIELVSYHN